MKEGKTGKADRHTGRCLASSPKEEEGSVVWGELRRKAGMKEGGGQKLGY